MLFATLLGLAAVAQAGDGRPGTLGGTVVEKGTRRPVAGVSVRFSQEPGSPSATTDARGRFDWLPGIVGGGIDGLQGPQAWVRADDDRARPWELVEPEWGLTYQLLYGQAVEAVYDRAATRWEGNDKGASLVVECPPVGEVEVIVRDPGGRPVADRPARILPSADSPRPSAGTIQFPTRTDREGAIRFRAFAGVHRFGVQVPGLGFGATGVFRVASGRVARPPLPPLARFARVEGRVAPGLLAPGIRVSLLSSPFPHPVGAPASCDDQGRFAMVDVIPGVYGIAAQRDGQRLRTALREVRPEPGGVLRDVVLEPAPPPTPEERKQTERTLRTLNGDRNRTITWVEGTIRDERGRPIPGALVYLRAEFNGGIRMYEGVLKTEADAAG